MNEKQQLFYTIGQNIKYYRELQNVGKKNSEKLTQEKLAELSNVSTSTIGGLESEKTKQTKSVEKLWKISKV